MAAICRSYFTRFTKNKHSAPFSSERVSSVNKDGVLTNYFKLTYKSVGLWKFTSNHQRYHLSVGIKHAYLCIWSFFKRFWNVRIYRLFYIKNSHHKVVVLRNFCVLNMSSIYAISSETLAAESRHLTPIMTNLTYCLGSLLASYVGYLMRDWRWYEWTFVSISIFTRT